MWKKNLMKSKIPSYDQKKNVIVYDMIENSTR